MIALNIFEWIGKFFTEVLFAPFEFLRRDESMDWWISNAANWLFLLVGLVLLAYWMKESLKFKKEGTEDRA